MYNIGDWFDIDGVDCRISSQADVYSCYGERKTIFVLEEMASGHPYTAVYAKDLYHYRRIRIGRRKHMRLINADDLIKAFEALDLMSGQYAESFTNMAGNRSMEIEYVKDYIDNAKTIDSVPVVHAHWVPEYPNKRTGKAYRHTCSECGRSVYNNRQVSIDEMGYCFCPHCGAKMDEEEKCQEKKP